VPSGALSFIPEKIFLPYAPEGKCAVLYPVTLVDQTSFLVCVEWPSPPFAEGFRVWVPEEYLLGEEDAIATE
jgi:hypothetical protein